MKLTQAQVRLLRLNAQRLLSSRQGTAAAVVQHIFAVQAQDLPAALLSVRARSRGLTAADVQHAWQVERSLAWTWCLRGTLHLLPAADARWLLPLLGPDLIAGDRRRMRQVGWDDDNTTAGMRLVRQALEHAWAAADQDGTGLTRPDIAALLKAHHLPFEGQAVPHLVFRMALEGILLRGAAPTGAAKKTSRSDEHAYVPFEAWLGPLQPLPHEEALQRLARRYLQAYAPAAPQDLAAWSGLKIGDARLAFKLLNDELAEVEAAGQPAWMRADPGPGALLEVLENVPPTIALLPRFDTFWMGWQERSFAIDPACFPHIFHGGMLDPALLVDGWALGRWQAQRQGKRLVVAVEVFEALPEWALSQVEAEAQDVGRFLGETAVTCNFSDSIFTISGFKG